MLPLTSGAKPLTTSRTADGKTFTPRTISMSSVQADAAHPWPGATAAAVAHVDQHVVAGPEAEERCAAMAQVG